MPLYEYTCEEDGTVLELIRPMDQADAPVTDPLGKGRHFKRSMSTFSASRDTPSGGGNLLARNTGSCCPCGKAHGGCRR